jgi:membrane-bound lytic murein transglycosylase A
MNSKLFNNLQRLIIATSLLTSFSCSHGPISSKKDALIKTSLLNTHGDDLNYESLKSALNSTIKKLDNSATDTMINYSVSFNMKEYLHLLKHINKCSGSKKSFMQNLSSTMSPYMSYGKDRLGEILLTSYYEPLIAGSLTKTKKLSAPLYQAPKNLVEVKLNQFNNELYGPIDTKRKTISAQLTEDKFGNKQVTPLPSRGDIDFGNALSNKNLEIAYVDPIEAFFLHIQGSGRVILADGKSFTVGYRAQNGMKYEPIGKFLKDEIPKEKMSLQSIEKVLRTKYDNNLEEILPLNPSYIFFKKITGRARTTIGAEVTDRRTLAVDPKFFNLGLIGHIDYPDLEITQDGAIEKDDRHQHFVINQDTGGAIKGPGRADLFWGSGKKGKRMAGHMRHQAKLSFYLPKKSVLKVIRSGEGLTCSQ